MKKWLEEHFKSFGVLLLLLAALNGWVGYSIFPAHPIMAFANGAIAGVITLGVMLSWGVGKSE